MNNSQIFTTFLSWQWGSLYIVAKYVAEEAFKKGIAVQEEVPNFYEACVLFHESKGLNGPLCFDIGWK